MAHGNWLRKKNAQWRTNSAAAEITSISRRRLGWDEDGRLARASGTQRTSASICHNRAAQERINGISDTPHRAADVAVFFPMPGFAGEQVNAARKRTIRKAAQC
jgi:hypothetical protein